MAKGGSKPVGKPNKPNGGTTAPSSAAKGPTTGLGQNQKPPGKAPSLGAGAPVPAANPNAGATWNPGQENPVVQPFLTPEQMMEYAQALQQYNQGLAELDNNYSSKKIDTQYEEGQVEKGRVQNKSSASNDLAARGLFRSSIRDADLADIDATAEIRRKFLSDSLSQLALYNQSQKENMQSGWNSYQEGVNALKVSNAQGAQANMPKYVVEPHWEKPATPAAPAPSNKPPKGGKPKANAGGGSKNGGTTAPPPNPSVSPKQNVNKAGNINQAKSAIKGKLA